MRTYQQAVEDQRQLEAAILHPTALTLQSHTLKDAVRFTQQARANVDCYDLFPGSSNRQQFLTDAYNLQVRAWMRIQGLVK